MTDVQEGEDCYDSESSAENQTFSGKKSFFKNQKMDIVETLDEPPKEKKPKNKQRVLLITSRGITYRYRHLMQDLNALLPHSKKDAKLDSKARLEDINEVAELNNCNNCLYFETRKHQDMYMWMAKTPNGPSAKFAVKNIHTMDELKLTGNCLKGSRPILSFDAAFQGEPYLQLLKEMFTQIYSVPTSSRKIKPFIDHVMSFSVVDNKIWIRNYQINEEKDAALLEKKQVDPITLVEIGPRFVLELIRIFDGSFAGSTLYENPNYVTPNNERRLLKGKKAIKHVSRIQGKLKRLEKMDDAVLERNPVDAIFD